MSTATVTHTKDGTKTGKAANKTTAKGHDRMPPKGGRGEKHVFTPRTTEIKGRKGDTSAPRDGSKRGQLLEILQAGGITIAAMEKKFDWKPRDCMDALRLLGKVNGLSLRLDDGGKWHATKK